MTPFDDRVCSLGEGPLWHPVRKQLFWFDILNGKLLSREGSAPREWRFDEMVSAAGWVDADRLIIASETKLFEFNIVDGSQRDLVPLEADMAHTRSNDGRADPWGGFWIGTMAKENPDPVGAFYRYYKGELRKLYAGLAIPNACCFSPDRRFATFTDTGEGIVKRVMLDPNTGWPISDPENWLDLSGQNWGADGAVIDADGNFWNAQWGASRVACYAPNGEFLRAVAVDAAQTSCPAFGGVDMTTLFCTTAAVGLKAADTETPAHHGKVFAIENIAKGQAEHQVIL